MCAFQPLYATVSDNVSSAEGHTSSRRGKVTNVQADINTHFGKAISVDVQSNGNLIRKNEYYAEEKIKYFQAKNNLKKVEYWKQQLEEYKVFNARQEENERCYVRVKLDALNSVDKNKFHYTFDVGNNQYIFGTQNLIDIFENWTEIHKLLPQLKVAKALEESNKNNV
jgi:hypothetical protein